MKAFGGRAIKDKVALAGDSLGADGTAGFY